MRPRALFSVSDKTGASGFAARLAAEGWDLLASGGTARLLREAGLEVEEVAAVTGSPEMLGGRVKTLHPAIHGALLCRPEQDAEDIVKHGIRPIALAVVNLYPFVEAASRVDVERAEIIEQIDVGGPAMIRAAAKNHGRVGVVVDPSDYDAVAAEIEAAGELGEDTRRRLAVKAFDHTARYDRAICGWLEGSGGESGLPERIVVELSKQSDLRYGENPHQQAAVYAAAGSDKTAGMRLLVGAPLSYNNLVDADLARQCVQALPAPACVIVKHATPCGVATGEGGAEAYSRAHEADPESAFGGVIAFNCLLDEAAARAVAGQFAEVLVAPGVSADALGALAARKKLRVLESPAGSVSGPGLPNLKVLGGAVLAQSPDSDTDDGYEVVSKRPADGKRTRRRALRLEGGALRLFQRRGVRIAGADPGDRRRADQPGDERPYRGPARGGLRLQPAGGGDGVRRLPAVRRRPRGRRRRRDQRRHSAGRFHPRPGSHRRG